MKQWDCTECELLDGGMLFCMGVCFGFVHIECNKQHHVQIVISMRTGMLVDYKTGNFLRPDCKNTKLCKGNVNVPIL